MKAKCVIYLSYSFQTFWVNILSPGKIPHNNSRTQNYALLLSTLNVNKCPWTNSPSRTTPLPCLGEGQQTERPPQMSIVCPAAHIAYLKRQEWDPAGHFFSPSFFFFYASLRSSRPLLPSYLFLSFSLRTTAFSIEQVFTCCIALPTHRPTPKPNVHSHLHIKNASFPLSSNLYLHPPTTLPFSLTLL